MSKASRDKGKRGEQEVARIVRHFLPDLADEVRRGWQCREGDDAPDVEGLPWWIEVKRRKSIALHRWYEQGNAATDGRPVALVHREDRGRWLVTIDFEDWLMTLGVCACDRCEP